MLRSRYALPLLLALAVTLALGACGEDDPGPPPSVVITYERQVIATVVAGCDAGELEDWYELASALVISFRDESAAALDLERSDMPDVLARLSTLRNTIAAQPAPDCALQAHDEILSVTQVTVTALQRYVENTISKDELGRRVQEVNQQIDTRISMLLSNAHDQLVAQQEAS